MLVYNYEFEDYEELERIVEKFMHEINNEISQGTNEIPVLKHQKEKEHLLPIPNQKILKSYVDSPKEYKVSKESMIKFNGKKYSVPTYLIGKSVTVEETDGYIYIYYTTNLVRKHKKEEKFLNYNKEDIIEILKSDALKGLSDSDIEAFIQNNLDDYDNL